MEEANALIRVPSFVRQIFQEVDSRKMKECEGVVQCCVEKCVCWIGRASLVSRHEGWVSDTLVRHIHIMFVHERSEFGNPKFVGA